VFGGQVLLSQARSPRTDRKHTNSEAAAGRNRDMVSPFVSSSDESSTEKSPVPLRRICNPGRSGRVLPPMRQIQRFLELLGQTIEGREALVAGRTGFVPVESRTAIDQCPSGGAVRLVALRDLARLPAPRPRPA
jgi:hypothetical protein